MTKYALVGDVGGTNARLALCDIASGHHDVQQPAERRGRTLRFGTFRLIGKANLQGSRRNLNRTPRIVLKELTYVFTALTKLVTIVGEPGAGFFDDIDLQGHVEHADGETDEEHDER